MLIMVHFYTNSEPFKNFKSEYAISSLKLIEDINSNLEKSSF